MIRASRVRVRTQMTVLISLLIAAIAMILVLYIPERLHAQALVAARAKASSMAELAAFSVSSALLFEDREGASEALAGLYDQSDFASVTVTDESGRVFARRVKMRLKADDHDVLRTIVPVMHGPDRIGKLSMDLSLESLRNEISASRRTTGIFIALVLAAGIAAALCISLVVTRPLQRIADAANAISSGDLTRRAMAEGSDEVSNLARAFNKMVDSVEQGQRQLEELNRDLENKVERRTFELQLEMEERKQLAGELRLVLQSAYDGIFAVDANGRCTFVNDSAVRILHCDSSSVVGQDLHRFLHDNSCAGPGCELAGALRDGERRSLTITLLLPDGRSLPAEFSVAPLTRGESRRGAVITFRDLSERDQLRRQLDDAERLSSLGRLAAMMAHEFNNVLMGILPFVEIARHSGSQLEPVVSSCTSITQSVKRGKRVTEEVLRYTRPAPPIRTPLDVVAWLEESAESFRVMLPPSIHVETIIAVESSPLVMAVDREQIDQVFANLISNARDAMPEGGILTLRVSAEPDFIHFEVADSGQGLAPDSLARIFEPFFTTKRIGGTGLGLPIAQQIITLHGGIIEAEAPAGCGMTFHIRLPRAYASTENGEPVPAGTELIAYRVLLVEDDDTVAAGIQGVLGLGGHEVILAVNGAEARRLLPSFEPDVMVLDIGLPDIDGVALYEELTRHRAHLPVVFSSGHGDKAKLTELLARQHISFLQKPYGADELLNAIAIVAATPALSF